MQSWILHCHIFTYMATFDQRCCQGGVRLGMSFEDAFLCGLHIRLLLFEINFMDCWQIIFKSPIV